MARKVIVFSTKTNNSKTIMSDATTWGDLRSELSSLLTESMVATVVATKNQLVAADALLPEGDFQLVLTPAQSKGASEIIDIASVIAELKDKFDTAFEEVLESIENGEHSSTSSSCFNGDDVELRAEAARIVNSLRG